MYVSKIILAVIISMILSTTAMAQQQAAQGGASPQGQGGGGSDSGVILDMTPFFTAVDTNKDEKVTSAEWKAADLPENVYDMFDKDKKGSFSKEDMAGKTHPPTIDANKDGKFSLDELKSHIKSQAQQGSGGAQGGATPGGAPAQK